MKKYFVVLLTPLLFTGCPFPATMSAMPLTSAPSPTPMWTVTSVNLSKKNYRIVKTDVTGSSWGFKLLGLITLKPVSYANAITELYQKAGVSTGKAQALANVSQQKSSPFFILFSIPRITFRADLVEFTEGLPPEGEMGPSSRAKEQSLGGKANPSALE